MLEYLPGKAGGGLSVCGKTTVSFLGPNESHFSTGESTAGEIIPSNTRHQCRLTTGLQLLCMCCVCVCVCVTAYSIIGPVGDGGSCGRKPTWNFLNKGLIFTGSGTMLEGVSLFLFSPPLSL